MELGAPVHEAAAQKQEPRQCPSCQAPQAHHADGAGDGVGLGHDLAARHAHVVAARRSHVRLAGQAGAAGRCEAAKVGRLWEATAGSGWRQGSRAGAAGQGRGGWRTMLAMTGLSLLISRISRHIRSLQAGAGGWGRQWLVGGGRE